MVDHAVWLAAAALLIAAGLQWRRARSSPSGSPARWLAWTLTALALSAALFTEGAGRVLAEASGVTNLAEPLARTALLAAAWLAPVLLAAVTAQEVMGTSAWRQAVPAGLALVALWTAFLTAPPGSLLRSVERDVPADGHFVVYTAAYLLVLAVALVRVTTGARRYARTATGALRVGLRLVGVGCVVGLGYVATRMATTVVSVSAPADSEQVQASVGRSLAVLAGLTVVAGCLTPSVDRAVRTLKPAVWAYVVHARLYPLWRLATTAFPDVALDPAPNRVRDLARLRDPELLLYRRIVELRDAQLALSAEPPRPELRHRAALGLECAIAHAPTGEGEVSVGSAEPNRAAVDLTLRQEALWWLQVAKSSDALPPPATSRANSRRPSAVQEPS